MAVGDVRSSCSVEGGAQGGDRVQEQAPRHGVRDESVQRLHAIL